MPRLLRIRLLRGRISGTAGRVGHDLSCAGLGDSVIHASAPSCEGGGHVHSGRHQYRRIDRIFFRIFDFPHQRQYSWAEVLDLLLEVPGATEDQVDAAFAVYRNAFRDLLGRSDQLAAEPVVVLHQVLEPRVRPHTALV